MSHFDQHHNLKPKTMSYQFKYFRAGRMDQIDLTCGADIAALAEADRKEWTAISMPVKGVRFDSRMLELMDTDHDGRIRTPEVLAAIEFLKSKNVDLDSLFKRDEADDKALADNLGRQADLAKVPPSEADKAAIADWEAKGKTPEVAVLGNDTADAEAALASVEKVVDDFFTPPEDMPLVTEELDKELPLKEHLNPKYLEAILNFSAKCVIPLFGEKATLSRMEWKKVKDAFVAYRNWCSSRPVINAGAKDALVEVERVLRYKMGLLEFLENFTNMKRLYDVKQQAFYQTGFLRIDAREMNLCFHVDSEAAHSALAAKSKCCVIYLKLSRPSDKAERSICAVVTAGTVGALYVGRNGVFYDRDGKDWEAVVTKVVEAQVSLVEAFWSPWRKLGEGVSGLVKKFLGDKQKSAQSSLAAGTHNAQSGGAAMASSIAAIGIGIGMMGAALASILAAVKGMGPAQIILSILAVITVVSLPSVILTWFKLRQRDIGAILNASGWAVNRPLHFTMKRARYFTVCPATPVWVRILYVAIVLLVLGALGWCGYQHYIVPGMQRSESVKTEQNVPATEPEQPAEDVLTAAPATDKP